MRGALGLELDSCLIRRRTVGSGAYLEAAVRTSFVTFLVLCLATGIAQLSAQGSYPVESGSLVRFTAPECDAHGEVATFETMRADTLVTIGSRSDRCPLTAVTRLELYGGRRSHPWRGAGIGFLAGATIGIAAFYATTDACFEGSEVSDCALVFGGGGGGLIGAVVGLFVGAVIRTDRWEPVPVGAMGLRPISSPRGLGLGVSVSF
jgi:hypothetical protein